MTYLQSVLALLGLFLTCVGLFVNIYVIRKGVISKKLSNYQEIVKSHREIWKMTLDSSERYSRILKRNVDLVMNPITYEEKRFVQFVLLHMTSSFNFSVQSEIAEIQKLKYDFDDFLSYPIPRSVWKSTKIFYNNDFIEFVENGAIPVSLFTVLNEQIKKTIKQSRRIVFLYCAFQIILF